MHEVSGSVGRDEISTLGPVSRRVVTSQFAYIQSFYYIQAYRQKQDDMTEIQIAYVGRYLVVVGSVLWLSVRLSFCLACLRKSTFDAI